MQFKNQVYFSIIPEWLTESEVSDNAFRVYSTLCRYADIDSGECYPSIKTIGQRCHKSPSTIKRAIKELQDLGAIKVESRFLDYSQTSNLYTIIFDKVNYEHGWEVKSDTGLGANMPHKLKSSNQSHSVKADKSGRKILFNSLSEALGYKPSTKQEIGIFNKVIKEISEAGGTAEQITQRVEIYKTKWKGITLTPTALLKHWSKLGQMYEENKPPEQYNCVENGHKWKNLDVIFHCQVCKEEKTK